MSIAVAALIRPSPLLRLALASLAAASLASTAWLLFTFRSLPATASLAMCLGPTLAALGLLHSAFRARKSFLLDISGLGEIRLREHYTGPTTAWWKETPSAAESAETVHVLESSTLWPGLLALRLKNAAGKRVSLVILPDSVTPDAFRALCLSLRWLAAQDKPKAPKHNEL